MMLMCANFVSVELFISLVMCANLVIISPLDIRVWDPNLLQGFSFFQCMVNSSPLGELVFFSA